MQFGAVWDPIKIITARSNIGYLRVISHTHRQKIAGMVIFD